MQIQRAVKSSSYPTGRTNHADHERSRLARATKRRVVICGLLSPRAVSDAAQEPKDDGYPESSVTAEEGGYRLP